MSDKTLTSLLAEVATEVGHVQKDKRNDHHGYGYASAEAVLSKVRAACAERGIAVVHSDASLVHQEGGLSIVKLEQTYQYGSEVASFSGLGAGKDGQDKGIMKANTAALKYLLALAFNLSWGDDPEASDPETGKKTSGSRKPKSKSKPKASPKKEAVAADDTIAKAIASAELLADLETIKPDIAALRTSDPARYNALKSAFVARRDVLGK